MFFSCVADVPVVSWPQSYEVMYIVHQGLGQNSDAFEGSSEVFVVRRNGLLSERMRFRKVLYLSLLVESKSNRTARNGLLKYRVRQSLHRCQLQT
jgi:hypothetical protein